MWERKYRDKFVILFFVLGLAEEFCSASTTLAAMRAAQAVLSHRHGQSLTIAILFDSWLLAELTNILAHAAKRGSRVCRSVGVWYGWMALLTLLFGSLRVWITYWLLRCGWQWAWLTLTVSAALWIWMLWTRRRSLI